jgi:hypothetical protein
LTTTETFLLLAAAVALYLLWRRKQITPALPAGSGMPSAIGPVQGLPGTPQTATPDAAAGIGDVGAPDSPAASPGGSGLLKTGLKIGLAPVSIGVSVAKGTVHAAASAAKVIGHDIAGMFGRPAWIDSLVNREKLQLIADAKKNNPAAYARWVAAGSPMS